MKFTSPLALVSALALVAGPALAQDVDSKLVVNGEIEMTTVAPAPSFVENLDEIYSGWDFRSSETQALQMDDFDNPGMIFVDKALEKYAMVDGSEGKSCASCHGEAASGLVGARAVYPKYREDVGEVMTIEMAINDCRTKRMGAEPWKYTGGDMVDMTALIASVSRGMPVNVAIDGPAHDTWLKGKEMYYTRTGQLELSCANCHEQSYGMMIRADHLSQGQINGFPTYRLKNAKLNSPHARFKGCVRDTRAETYKPGSPEFVALELYVASRGNGLSVEGPSVRN
ncbi:MAG: sulfur oxidation c-type cytochrome SoxA [Marinibacterium sp.]